MSSPLHTSAPHRAEHTTTVRRAHSGYGIAIALAATLTALLPFATAWGSLTQIASALLIGAGALVAQFLSKIRASDLRPIRHFLLYLSPVLLLSLAFPLVTARMAEHTIDGIPLSSVVLACSLTVPWLAQAACLPAYRAIGPLMAQRDGAAITRALTEHWPIMFVSALPLTVLGAVVVWSATGWGLEPVATYFVLVMLHVFFVQSLVAGDVMQRRGLWAIGWASYAVALLAAPQLWWLPPLVGGLTQVVAMGSHIIGVRSAQRIPLRDLGHDLVRGTALGSVLWADKLVLYLVVGASLPVTTIFAAMFPAVLAYNYYFVRQAPAVDRAVNKLHEAIAGESMAECSRRSAAVAYAVDRAVLRTGAVGMVATLAVSCILTLLQPQSAASSVAIGLASWSFMMVTLVSYQLDYIGERAMAMSIGGLHLVAVCAAFLLLSPLGAYLALLVVDVILLGIAWHRYRWAWQLPHFTLFWRHAIGW